MTCGPTYSRRWYDSRPNQVASARSHGFHIGSSPGLVPGFIESLHDGKPSQHVQGRTALGCRWELGYTTVGVMLLIFFSSSTQGVWSNLSTLVTRPTQAGLSTGSTASAQTPPAERWTSLFSFLSICLFILLPALLSTCPYPAK